MKHFYWFYRCFRVPQKLCVLHTLSCLIIISLTLFNTPDASAQAGGKKTITGKVTDAMGLPLPGVIVATTSGPKLGTQTDNNGRFVLDV